MTPIKYVRMPALIQLRGTSHTTFYRHIKEGLWPPAVHLSANTSAWPEHEVAAIDAARLAGATDDEVRTLVRKLVADRRQQAAA